MGAEKENIRKRTASSEEGYIVYSLQSGKETVQRGTEGELARAAAKLG